MEDRLGCSVCGGRMREMAALSDYAVVDRIIGHLNLTIVAEKPLPHMAGLMAAETSAEYFS
jgi:hypothetical protein